MKMIFFILSAIFLLLSANVFAQVIYKNDNVEITKLTDKIFLLKENHHFTANITVLTGSDGILLVDTGFGDAAEDLKNAVNELSKGEVKYIINTHPNGDHVGGNEIFGRNVLLIGLKYGEEYYSRAGLKVKCFEDKYSLNFHGEEVKCIALPGGHTLGDIIIHFPESKIACLGDLYLSESFPVIGVRGGASARALVKNLKKALEILPGDTKLIPGHGKVTTMKDLKDYLEMVETTIKIVRKEMDSGKNMEEIQNSDVLKDYGEWGRFFSFIRKDTWIRDIYLSYSGDK